MIAKLHDAEPDTAVEQVGSWSRTTRSWAG
jgi:hypothetical protein